MKARKGRQTPTKSVVLPYRKSKGKEAIELYNRTGRKAQKWQEKELKNILAVTPKGLWVHSRYGYAVPRRNGKNEIIVAREMFGLINNERILHTAHRTATSHAAWERLIKLLTLAGYKEDRDFKTYKQLGFESVIWLARGSEAVVNFRTRSSKGGLGEGYDLLVIDEAQEYTDDQKSALQYVVTDSRNPQTIYCGTPPTPISSGTVFSKYPKATLNGETVHGGWAEWSVDSLTDVYDKEAWYETNPSLGTIIKERAVMDEIGDDTIDFNIQRLGLWIKYNQKSAISKAEWESLRVESLPEISGDLYVGIRYGHDGNNVAMSIAVRTEDKVFVECIDCRPVRAGTDWIVAFLRSARTAKVVVDGQNGQSILAEAMKDVRLKPPVMPTVNEVCKATAAFELAVQQGAICHMDQPALTQAVSNCEKRPIGSRGGFGYQSLLEGIEIALLDSVILAFWICSESRVKQKQRISY